jgi:hypothetical protein
VAWRSCRLQSPPTPAPLQNRPKVAIDNILVERLERRDQGMNLDPGRKRLAAAPDEHQSIAQAGRAADVARLVETAAIKLEAADEEVAEFRIMADPIFHEHQGPALAGKIGLLADLDPAHGFCPA